MRAGRCLLGVLFLTPALLWLPACRKCGCRLQPSDRVAPIASESEAAAPGAGSSPPTAPAPTGSSEAPPTAPPAGAPVNGAPPPTPPAAAPRNGATAADVCQKDTDCAPAACCHATACLAKAHAPSCADVMCTMECRGGTIDCGGGCTCQAGRCAARYGSSGPER